MFAVFGVDYLDIDNKDFFDENDNIKYNINIDDMPNTCFFVAFMNTEEEAKKVFIKHKEAAILAKADLYKDRIPRKLYDAMVNWSIELSDWNK